MFLNEALAKWRVLLFLYSILAFPNLSYLTCATGDHSIRSQLVSVEHQVMENLFFLLFRNENLCCTVIKIKIKPTILASIEEYTIISSIRIPKLLNPVVAHMQIRIWILLFSSVTLQDANQN
jgi:hypothetical protein